jgi:hypothetical protein
MNLAAIAVTCEAFSVKNDSVTVRRSRPLVFGTEVCQTWRQCSIASSQVLSFALPSRLFILSIRSIEY